MPPSLLPQAEGLRSRSVPPPAPPCDHRCIPPCPRCLEGARWISLGVSPTRNVRIDKWLSLTCLATLLVLLGLSAALSYASRSYGLPNYAPLPCLASPLAAITVFLALTRHRRGEVARIRSGQCAFCGYALSNLTATETEYDGRTFQLLSCPECGRWNSHKARFAYLAGELEPWPSMEKLAEALKAGGLTPLGGRYSIRIKQCPDFSFEHYGGDLSMPTISADADTPRQMTEHARVVSAVLARAGLRHRFEVYDDDGVLVAYFHHDWSQQPAVSINHEKNS